jgi:hypothetical protein
MDSTRISFIQLLHQTLCRQSRTSQLQSSPASDKDCPLKENHPGMLIRISKRKTPQSQPEFARRSIRRSPSDQCCRSQAIQDLEYF